MRPSKQMQTDLKQHSQPQAFKEKWVYNSCHKKTDTFFSYWNKWSQVCGVDGKTYQNICFSSCTLAQDPQNPTRQHIRCRGKCPCNVRSAGPKKNPQEPEQINNTAAVAGPAHDPEAIKETTVSQDKPTKPKKTGVQQSNGKPDAIETTFRLADSNKDGVQDLAEFWDLEDVKDMVKQTFQHYDKVW